MHSSTSMAIKFRKSMVVGFINTSPREMVGNSRGKPPALHTPRLTASATCLRCALQLVSSDHELAMPITGRPSKTRSLNPSVLSHERWTKPSRSLRPNQLRLLSWCAVMGTLRGPDYRGRRRGAPVVRGALGCDKGDLHATRRQGGSRDGWGQRHRPRDRT